MKSAIKSTEQEHRRLLKIGEVSKQSGVGIETLRFYEKLGLLGRPARTASGYRLYDKETLERLDFIKRAQVLGFTLAEIARIIAEKQAGQSPCAEVREIVRARLKELDERMREMQRYRKELAAALNEWETAGDRKGHVCGLIEGTTMKHSLTSPPVLKRGKDERHKH
jgi:DNA-binding transcriptional MerR regulator